jgi:hypothetical protein
MTVKLLSRQWISTLHIAQHNWRQPRNYNDVQKFVGLVQYLDTSYQMYRVILDRCQPCPRMVSHLLGDHCTTSVLRWLSTSAVKHLCSCLWTMTKTTQSGLSAMHWYLVWVQCMVKDQCGKPAGQQVSCHINSQMHTTVSLSKRQLWGIIQVGRQTNWISYPCCYRSPSAWVLQDAGSAVESTNSLDGVFVTIQFWYSTYQR